MRILSWVQNKVSGGQEKKKFDTGSCSSRRTSGPDDRKEEFSDWPQSLLSIGTLGTSVRKEENKSQNHAENRISTQEVLDFSAEEVVKLQKELTKLLTHKPKLSTDRADKGNHPLNRFLNCPSSLEVERRDRLQLCCDSENGENNGDLSPNSRIILNKAKDILSDKTNTMKQKSLTFLLKKMFVCGSGFSPPRSLRDPLPESRMEKLLRVILHKQIHPQSSNKIEKNKKKKLEKKPVQKIGYKEEMPEIEEDGSKWVKTDTEFIVLEI